MFLSHFMSRMTQSTAEAELLAAGECTRTCMWFAQLLAEIGWHDPNPIVILIDDQSTIFMAVNQATSHRTRHIKVKYQLLIQQTEEGTVKPVHVPSEDNWADHFTKPLLGEAFKKMRVALMGKHRHKKKTTPRSTMARRPTLETQDYNTTTLHHYTTTTLHRRVDVPSRPKQRVKHTPRKVIDNFSLLSPTFSNHRVI